MRQCGYLTLCGIVRHHMGNMDRAERAELLLQQEEATKQIDALVKKIDRYVIDCSNTATALRLVFSHSDVAPECFSKVDNDMLVLPDISGRGGANEKLHWDRLTEINPDRQLSGMIQTVIKFRNAKANLKAIRRKLN